MASSTSVEVNLRVLRRVDLVHSPPAIRGLVDACALVVTVGFDLVQSTKTKDSLAEMSRHPFPPELIVKYLDLNLTRISDII